MIIVVGNVLSRSMGESYKVEICDAGLKWTNRSQGRISIKGTTMS
jgi:hypothetical protein